MNYLAHIYLARYSDDAMLGALLGDFVKPHSGARFSATIEAEIRTHRKIDAFTDSHPLILEAKARFEGPRRRYAGTYNALSHRLFVGKDQTCLRWSFALLGHLLATCYVGNVLW